MKLSDISFKTPRQAHTFCVYNDVEFEKAVSDLPEENDKNLDWQVPYKQLAEEFFVKYMDVYRYKVIGKEKALNTLKNLHLKGLAYFDVKTDSINLMMPKNITEADYRELWKKVSKLKEAKGFNEYRRRRTREDPLLYYALFKAFKQNGLTAKQVYDLYLGKDLPLYEGKRPKEYMTENKLRDLYSNYLRTLES